MVKTNKLVTGLIAGAALGAVAGILFAPKPGKESRQIVTAQAKEFRNKADGLRNKAGGYVDAMRSRGKSKETQPVLAEATNGHVNGTA